MGKAKKDRAENYEEKVAINGSFEDVIGVSVNKKNNMNRWKKIESIEDVNKLKRGMYVLRQNDDKTPSEGAIGENTTLFAVKEVLSNSWQVDLVEPEIEAKGLGLDLGYSFPKLYASPLHKLFDMLINEGHWYYDLQFKEGGGREGHG